MTKDKSSTFCTSVKCQCLMFLLTAGCVAVVVCVALLSTSVRWRRPPDLEWWQKTVVYQIYPRSFMDSDGDGIGDLRGIIDKMDYFPYLNVKTIWISPVYESPMKDFGYDIKNFTDIDERFGNLTDMTELIEEAHKKNVKVIVDFVPNHSSHQHMWFNESVKNENKYKDYYIWTDCRLDENGTAVPPNNWLSVFKNSAWEWSPARNQCYYHAFLTSQPDLNYRNSDVVDEMKNVLRFWLDRGVDGFRIDALAFLFEVTDLSKNEPPSHADGFDETQWKSLDHIYTQNQMKDLTRILGGWRTVLNEYEVKDDQPRFLVVEAYTKNIKERNYWYSTGADMPFYFGLVALTPECGGSCVSDMVHQGYQDLPDGAWPNFVLGNHDKRRVSTRKGVEYVDVLNMLLLTLRGTPTTYYGEEIGMLDVMPTYNQTQDPQGKPYGPEGYQNFSRNPERSPMQWSNTYMGGFTSSSDPWLPIRDYSIINVEGEKNKTASSLQLYRTLAKLREESSFSYGTIHNVVVNDNIFSYVRHATDFSPYLVALNLGNITSTDDYSGDPVNTDSGVIVARTGNSDFKVDDKIDLAKIKLEPAQGLVIKL